MTQGMNYKRQCLMGRSERNDTGMNYKRQCLMGRSERNDTDSVLG